MGGKKGEMRWSVSGGRRREEGGVKEKERSKEVDE